MENLFDDALIQHLLRSAGVDFLSGIDGDDPVVVLPEKAEVMSPVYWKGIKY